MAKVSIVLPIYNVENYLRECLDSVQKQTLKDIEIICVDDGSTDSSLSIINEYAKRDGRFIVLTGPNGGYGKAMNRGMASASGEYIGIVEPDDFVLLNMFEELYEIAHQNNLDFVKSDFYRFTRDKNKNMNLFYNQLDKSANYYNILINPSETPEITYFILNTWCGIYKRDFLLKNNIKHNETPGASFQDNGFYWLTTTAAQRAMFIDKPYYMNRRDNPNSSVKSKAKVYCMNEEYEYIRTILERDPEIWNRFKYTYTLRKFHNCRFILDRVAHEYKKEYIETISNDLRKSAENGEIDRDCYTESEWNVLQQLMNDPEEYYYKNYAPKDQSKKIAEISSELDAIKNSTTYKVGKIIMYVPCKLKKKYLASKRK